MINIRNITAFGFGLVTFLLRAHGDTNTLPTTGNVGIGTLAPSTALEVRKDHATDPVVRFSNAQITRSPVLLEFRGDYNGTGTLYRLAGLSAKADGTSWTDSRLTLQSVNENGSLIDTLTVKNGNVGIGTVTPAAKVEIFGGDAMTAGWNRTAMLSATYPVLAFNSNNVKWAGIGYDFSSNFNIWVNAASNNVVGGSIALSISQSGNIGIGTTNPTQKLSVNGAIRAKEVIVDTGWSDYVFAPDYTLAPLSEVEAHINEHQHLPGIPSAKEVAEHGISLGDMQARLLAKIEELTLHVIGQEKQVAALTKRVWQLEAENHSLQIKASR